jgi:hypothetical protein
MAKGPQVLTANSLRDGEVVYWRAGAWVRSFDRAEILGQDANAQAALAQAQAFVRERIVVNPYLFDVREVAGQIRAVEERELIRAAGPTVRRDLGKQARHVSL